MAPKRVAVIGAGPAGLAAARHLGARPLDFQCHVFEQNDDVGGTWRLSEYVGTDQHGLPVHSSMYKYLKTNLPKEMMLYPDFPIPDVPESYVPAGLVLKYIEDYVTHYNLRPLIHLSHHVKCVRPLAGDAWELEVTDLSTKVTQKHEFDAVMVCNGHFSDPIMPNLEGTDEFQGSQIHSHDYRVPEIYQGQKVLVVGAGPSAMDVVQEVHEFATQVIMSHHKTINTKFPDNVQQVCDVKRLTSHGAEFVDGSKSEFDSIIYCTGYKYSLPFLDPSCGISVDAVTGVGPLYRHILHLERPTMCFVALVNHVVPFPLADLQSRYFLRVLDGSLQLPSLEERRADTARDQEKRRVAGHVGTRLSHYLGPMQREYYDLLATEAGIEPIPPVISALHAESHKGILHNLFNYRKIKFRIVDHENFERFE